MVSRLNFNPQACWDFLSGLVSERQFLVAYSGGVDSHVLLHALSFLRDQGFSFSVRAVHVNHGLSPNALMWEKHCRHVCNDLNIPLQIQSVNIKNDTSQSIEAAARTARYEAIKRILKPGENVLTAHHQDDQAETVLLQLLRGAGVKGLSAMPVVAPFASGFLVRPLLGFTRESLLSYAKTHNLQWVDDESNENINFQRNYLRKLAPEFKKHWPAFSKTLSRSALHCANAADLLEDYAQEDLTKLRNSPDTLSVSGLLNLSLSRCQHVLRVWLHEKGFTLPSAIKLQKIISSVLHAREDARPSVHWSGVIVRRYRDALYADAPLLPHDSSLILPWSVPQNLTLPSGLGVLSVKAVETGGIYLPEDACIEVRFRQGGEKLRLPGRTGRHCLKKCFQTWGVPPWLRDRVPLVYINQQLAVVAGYAVGQDFLAGAGEKNLEIVQKKRCRSKHSNVVIPNVAEGSQDESFVVQ